MRNVVLVALFTVACLIGAGAPAGADELVFTDSFAFGPGTDNTFFSLASGDSAVVAAPAIINAHVTLAFDSGCCFTPLRVRLFTPDGITVFDRTATFSSNQLDLGRYTSFVGCPRTWRVRVETANGIVPRAKISGKVRFSLDPPTEAKVKLRDGKLSLDAHSLSTDRVLTGCIDLVDPTLGGSTQTCGAALLTGGQGLYVIEAKWQRDPLALGSSAVPDLTASLVRPDGRVVATHTGERHGYDLCVAPPGATCADPSLLHVEYVSSAADALLSGTWKLRVQNDSPVRVVDFNVESSFDSLLDVGIAEFHSRFIPECSSVGGFALTPAEATVDARAVETYAFTWVVTTPGIWHDLRDLQFRIRDDQDTIVWVRFDEADQRFSVYHEAAGKFGSAGTPGTSRRLETPFVSVDLSQTSVVVPSPTSPKVTLNLALGFKPRAAGRTYTVEVAATDKAGVESGFLPAGTVYVSPH